MRGRHWGLLSRGARLLLFDPDQQPSKRWARRNGQEGCPWAHKQIRQLVPVLDEAGADAGCERNSPWLRLLLMSSYGILSLEYPRVRITCGNYREISRIPYFSDPGWPLWFSAHGYHIRGDRQGLVEIRR